MSARPSSQTVPLPAGVGATALFIAALRAFESTRTDCLFPGDPLAEALIPTVDAQTSQLWIDSDGEPTALSRELSGYVGLRTRYFDDVLTRAVAGGVRQVVILGAGLDGRPYRLPLPGATVFEVDTADVLQFKQDAVQRHHLTPVATVRTVIADIREDWATSLLDSGFDPTQRTVWLAEGLLFYLSADDCAALRCTVSGLSPAGGVFAMEYPHGDMAAVLDDISPTPATRTMIRAFVEAGPQEPPATWLAGTGWSLEATDVARLAAVLDRQPPSWSGSPGFTWWFATASWAPQ